MTCMHALNVWKANWIAVIREGIVSEQFANVYRLTLRQKIGIYSGSWDGFRMSHVLDVETLHDSTKHKTILIYKHYEHMHIVTLKKYVQYMAVQLNSKYLKLLFCKIRSIRPEFKWESWDIRKIVFQNININS